MKQYSVMWNAIRTVCMDNINLLSRRAQKPSIARETVFGRVRAWKHIDFKQLTLFIIIVHVLE